MVVVRISCEPVAGGGVLLLVGRGSPEGSSVPSWVAIVADPLCDCG